VRLMSVASHETETPRLDGRASIRAVGVLLTRSSIAPKTLRAPSPTADELQILIAAALTAPDHGALRPWRFILIEGSGREQLSRTFLEIRKRDYPRIRPHELARSWRKTMRAPMLVGVVARLVRDNAKVPLHEQYISVGAAIHGIMLACHALGFGAIMLSGDRARDPLVRSLFQLVDNEEMIGFISIGTPLKTVSPKPRPPPGDHLQIWRGLQSST
jgi:nitroreductase